MKIETNSVAFTANNGLSFLAGERFNVLAAGHESVWLEHVPSGARLFVGCVFYALHMVRS